MRPYNTENSWKKTVQGKISPISSEKLKMRVNDRKMLRRGPKDGETRFLDACQTCLSPPSPSKFAKERKRESTCPAESRRYGYKLTCRRYHPDKYSLRRALSYSMNSSPLPAQANYSPLRIERKRGCTSHASGEKAVKGHQ